MGVIVKALWILFIAGQILNAGNMNYQQQNGYYEINDLVYGKHPSANEIYIIKTAECMAIYGATKVVPKYEKPILIVANIAVWGMIIRDKRSGIKLNFRW